MFELWFYRSLIEDLGFKRAWVATVEKVRIDRQRNTKMLIHIFDYLSKLFISIVASLYEIIE